MRTQTAVSKLNFISLTGTHHTASSFRSDPVTYSVTFSDEVTSTGLSPSALKLTPDIAPGIVTWARVHEAWVSSNTRGGTNGVGLQDKPETAALREKIAPLVKKQNHRHRATE